MAHRDSRLTERGASRVSPLRRSRDLLHRVIETPGLVSAVQGLAPRTLGRLIEAVGLEDAGEIVALATIEQIVQVFDEDLWKSEKPGKDAVFSPERFVLWLEVLLESGEAFVARRLSEMPEDLVMLALGRHIVVLNMDDLAVTVAYAEREQDVDVLEKALDSCLCHEFDAYRVITRKSDGWDTILSVMVALDEHHPHLFQRILARCCHASTEYIEENGGLYKVLTSEEMLESDAAADREDRRAAKGFIAPSQAAAFLRLAMTTDPGEIAQSDERDPITHAYFRDLERSAPGARREPDASAVAASERGATHSSASRLLGVMRQAGVEGDTCVTRRLPSGSTETDSQAEALFGRAIAALFEKDPIAYSARVQELAYLSNVLVSGCSFEGRVFRSSEAVEAVVAVCNAGLAHLLEKTSHQKRGSPLEQRAVAALTKERADKLFRMGWRLVGEKAPFARSSGSTPVLTKDQLVWAKRLWFER